MIQGVGTRQASHSRTPTEARIMAARAKGAAAAMSCSRILMSSGRRPSAAGSVAKPDLALANRNLRRHIVRKLAEPADVRDDERTAQHERADRDPGRLAHRRKAQVDADIAALEKRPESRFVCVAERVHMLSDAEVRSVEQRVELKTRRGRTD